MDESIWDAAEAYLDGVSREVMRVSPNPSSETRSPKPEKLKAEARGPRPEKARSPRPKVHSQKPDTRSLRPPKPEARSPKPEVRSQVFEAVFNEAGAEAILREAGENE